MDQTDNLEELAMNDPEPESNFKNGNPNRTFRIKNYIPQRNYEKYQKHFYILGSIIITLIIIIIIVIASLEKSHEIPSQIEEQLMLCNDKQIWTFDANIQDFHLLFETKNPIKGFDTYEKNQIFWSESTKIFTLTKGFEDRNIDTLFEELRSSPQNMAVDFITGNLYVIDDAIQGVMVINRQSKNFTFLFVDFDGLSEIVLDPETGFLFTLQRNNTILRGFMDGSSLLEVVSGRRISALSLDRRNRRLYWVEDRVSIKSSDYSGEIVGTVLSDTEDIVSLAVGGDRLFWLWHDSTSAKPVLWSCRITGGASTGCEDHRSRPVDSVSEPRHLRAAPLGGSSAWHPCQSANGRCDDLCLAVPSGERKCACGLGRRLNPDGKTCRPVADFVLYASGERVHGKLTESPRADVFWPTPYQAASLIKGAIDFDYDLRNDYFYFSDDSHICRTRLRSANWTGQEVLLTGRADEFVEDLALDWLAGNLYYSLRSKLRSKEHSLMVMSLRRPGHLKKLEGFTYDSIFGMQACPYAMAVDPVDGYLVFTAGETNTRYVMRTSMNGTRLSRIEHITYVHEFRLLAIDYEEDRIYWIASSSSIEHCRPDGSDRKSLRSIGVINAKTIAVHRQWIYLSTESSVYRVRKSDGQGAECLAEPGRNVAGVRIVSSATQRQRNSSCELNSPGCEQFCFPGTSVACDCEDGKTVRANGTCA